MKLAALSLLLLLSACRVSQRPLAALANALPPEQYAENLRGTWRVQEFYGKRLAEDDALLRTEVVRMADSWIELSRRYPSTSLSFMYQLGNGTVHVYRGNYVRNRIRIREMNDTQIIFANDDSGYEFKLYRTRGRDAFDVLSRFERFATEGKLSRADFERIARESAPLAIFAQETHFRWLDKNRDGHVDWEDLTAAVLEDCPECLDSALRELTNLESLRAIDNLTGGAVDGKIAQVDLLLALRDPRFSDATRFAARLAQSPPVFNRIEICDEPLGPDGLATYGDFFAFHGIIKESWEPELSRLAEQLEALDNAWDPTSVKDGYLAREDFQSYSRNAANDERDRKAAAFFGESHRNFRRLRLASTSLFDGGTLATFRDVRELLSEFKRKSR